MSAFSGKQNKGAMRSLMQAKRVQAEARQKHSALVSERYSEIFKKELAAADAAEVYWRGTITSTDD